DGTTMEHTTPEQIDPADLVNIIAVAAGSDTSYALSSDGSIWDWGYNGNGNLGLGYESSPFLTPQHLLPPSGYIFTSLDSDSQGAPVVATLAAVPLPEPASGCCIALLACGGWMALLRRRTSIMGHC